MKDLGMKPGFTVLFHGFPGTGKTESVFQISRLTGRDIKRVEMAETKSKWFGESEKRIKQVFDLYKQLVNTSELTPILLFNEVDGVFGTRKTVGSSSVDQTENTIQNIILQEMEDFKGILLSTTNLPKNLDKGFSRRFLFKTYFDKPNSETRFLIWRDKLHVLTDEQIRYMSETYEMTGGQIDNVVKKIVMNQILKGTTPDLNEIEEFCNEEFLERKTDRNKIGFRVGSV
jgi:SpoVK/Ycf46/Vps4 family AAA+-type ATPase